MEASVCGADETAQLGFPSSSGGSIICNYIALFRSTYSQEGSSTSSLLTHLQQSRLHASSGCGTTKIAYVLPYTLV